MTEHIGKSSVPSRIKIDWRSSQEVHFNNSDAIKRSLHSGKNLFGHSLDSKINSLAVNKHEFYDVVEDGRPLFPTEHLSQNQTQAAKTSEAPNVNSSISLAFENEANLSKNFPSSAGRKRTGSKKQYESALFSQSLDSCKSSQFEGNDKKEFNFTRTEQRSPKSLNLEFYEEVKSGFAEKQETVTANNNKETKYSEVMGNSLHDESNIFKEQQNPPSTTSGTVGSNLLSWGNREICSDVRNTGNRRENGSCLSSSQALGNNISTITFSQSNALKSHLSSSNENDYEERQDWMLPEFAPEIPPFPPQSNDHISIKRYSIWNEWQWIRVKSNLPRAINVTIYCGSRSKYRPHSSYFSANRRTEKISTKELYKDPEYDLGFDHDLLSETLSVNKSDSEEEEEHSDVWNNNYAHNPADPEMNWSSTFESDCELSGSDVFDTQSSTETIDNINCPASYESNQNNGRANEVISSQNFETDKARQTLLTNHSFTLSNTQQRVKIHPGSTPSTSSYESWSTRLSTDGMQTLTVPCHQDSRTCDAHNDVRGSSNNGGNNEYPNTYTQKLESRTFEEEANTPWTMQTSQFIPSSPNQHRQHDKELHYNQNRTPDEIQKIPISSKTLPLPHFPEIIQSWDTTPSQSQGIIASNINYNCDEQNVPKDEHEYKDHGHSNTDPTNGHHEAVTQHMPSESGHFVEPVVSTKRVCYYCNGRGNCANCKAMAMMDTMKGLSQSAGFIIHDVLPDGNCMFRSIVDQLRMHGEHDTTATILRIRAVEYLTNNPCSEDGTHMKDFLLTETWEQYLERMKKDGEWGDEIALRGISEVLKRKICIISAVGKQHNQITIKPRNAEIDESEALFLGHLNDSHYLSLRPSNWQEVWYNNSRKTKHKKSKVYNSEKEDNKYEESYPEFKGMLDLNEELENSLLDKDQGIDRLSMCPLQHLNFVMKNVINAKYLVPTEWGSIKNSYKIQQDRNAAYKRSSIGIASEDLAVTVHDKFGMRSVKQNQKLILPTLLVICPYILIGSGRDASTDIDLIINDNNVHQGYLRLRPASDKLVSRIQTHVTSKGENTPFLKQSMLDTDEGTKIYGDWSHEGVKSSTSVAACFKCNFWPDATSEWLSRERPSGWPVLNRREQAINTGCLVVSDAHPLSTKPEIEFMYVFGEAEKILARSFLKSQKYCFHVFRLIVEFAAKGISHLTTYHIKTIFLYASEIVPRQYWKLHPGACLLFLISRLLTCIKYKNLPHYFMKGNNLIDYFSEDTQAKLLKRLMLLREFPVMAVTLLAEEHGLSSTWMADPIIRDIEQFCVHQDLKLSVFNVFIPTSFLLAEKFVKYNMYIDAAEVIMENFKNVRSLCEVCKESIELPPLFCLIQPFLNVLNRWQQWWLCLFLDLEFDEKTLPSLTKNEEGKTIADILGDDSEGILGHVFVPYQVLVQESCPSICNWEEGSPDVDIDFMFQLTFYLSFIKDKEICLHYQRHLVHLINRKITDAKSIFASDETEENIESEKARNRVGHLNVSVLYQKLYDILTTLFETYEQEDQPELFQEFIHDLEDACDVLATRCAYKKLSNIWLKLGSSDMSQRALAKRRNLNR